jgi:hypothetical protein
MDYSNLYGGLRVQTQIPLDAKEYALTLNELSNLGLSNNLAYTYTEGLIVYCVENKKRYEWRQVSLSDQSIGLLANNFIYQESINTYGINYSNRAFNFFEYKAVGPKGDQGEQGLTGSLGNDGPQGIPGNQGESGLNGINGLNGTNGISAYLVAVSEGYTGTELEWLLSLQGPQGIQGLQGTEGESSLNIFQKSINEGVEIINANYTLIPDDNNKIILINNFTQALKIEVPAGMPINTNITFIQRGTEGVSFLKVGGGVIYTPSTFLIKGQYFETRLRQIGTTNNYHLTGDLTI